MNPRTTMSRAARLVAVGGVAAGIGMFGGSVLAANPLAPAAVVANRTTAPAAPTATNSAGHAPSSLPNTSAATLPPPATANAPGPARPAPAGGGDPRPGNQPDPLAGTITAVNGTTLTLRTERGTETVTTTTATTVEDGREKATLADLSLGDVVHIRPVAAPAPGTAGTGAVAATDVHAVYPQLSGRVTAIAGNAVTLAGRDGATLTVTTGSATKYFNGPGADATTAASAVTVGSHITAWGDQDTATHISADWIDVHPAGAPGA